MISQDRSQGQSGNLCFSCFFLASAHSRKFQAVCVVERCVAGPHRAQSEINLVPLESWLCKESQQQLLYTAGPFLLLEKIARADSTLFTRSTDMTHVFSVVFIYLFCLLKAKHALSEEWKLQIPDDGRRLKWL